MMWVHRKCATCRLGRAYCPHCWELLNPATTKPFRHGRVVFMCGMRRARRPPRLSDHRAQAAVVAAHRSAELDQTVSAARPNP